MNTFKIFSIAFLTSVTLGFAQDVNQAKKAIDAEQYDKAKSMLKSILKTNPIDGRANFLLGNIYLKSNSNGFSKTSFSKRISRY